MKHIVDDNIICLLATQLMHAPVLVARNTVQQLLRKTLNAISPELWLQQARAELNRLQDLGSLQRLKYELQVNKIKEIKQRLVELYGKAIIQYWREKMPKRLCSKVIVTALAVVLDGLSLRPHQQQCRCNRQHCRSYVRLCGRSNIRLCCHKRQQCRTILL